MPLRRNILHIVADQHHARMLGCVDPQVITPHTDALAADGIRFTNHYTQNPICTPSRVCFHSGQYCHNHGYYSLNGPTPAIPSYLHHFRAQGYRTSAIGKLHLPNNPRHWLEGACDLLADAFAEKESNGELTPYGSYLADAGLAGMNDSNHLKERSGPHHWDARPSDLPLEHCIEAWITKTAIDFIDRQAADAPFCMHLSYPRPHHILTPDRRFWDMYPEDITPPETIGFDSAHRPVNFRNMVKYCREELTWTFEPRTYEAAARRVWRGTLALATQNDYFFAKLFDHLRRTGRFENTVIVVTADHGLYHGHYGIMEKAPGICSDAICRVPSVWRVPGVNGGRVVDALIEHVDCSPTFCALAGLPPMDTVDGVDLSPVLRGEVKSVKEVAVTEWPWSKALRWKQWRFVHYHRKMYGGEDVGELYDIEADPWETRNLYHDPACQSVVGECRRRLIEWLTETTRITTAWPYLSEDWPAFGRRVPFAMGADGREPNTKGPAARLSRGVERSFDPRDYL
jgi:choline-sulfatase/uncharacterized sulfatase